MRYNFPYIIIIKTSTNIIVLNYSQANLLSNELKQIPNAWIGLIGYLKSMLNVFSDILPNCR